MKVSHNRIPQGILIRFSGELDHHEAGRCIEYLEKIMTLYSTDRIFLDFSTLTFMDSSGIAVVLNAQRNSLGAGQNVCVVGAPAFAMRIFRAAGLLSRIRFEPDLPDVLPEEEYAHGTK
ncbi:MAG: anti-sigma factor antagonist [Butyricicoccus sp.]